MSAKRITMRKIRDSLRLQFAAGLSIRQIRVSTKVSVGAIQNLLAKTEGLACPCRRNSMTQSPDRMRSIRDATSPTHTNLILRGPRIIVF